MSTGTPTDIQDLIAAAGGQIVGRTRLQKAAYLLERMGLGYGFAFSYHHYGPYSEDVAVAAEDAVALGLAQEEVRQASWGGNYSVYRAASSVHSQVPARQELLRAISAADPVALELAATAAFLADEGAEFPWDEVAARKHAKATPGNLEKARSLYAQLGRVASPKRLPSI